MAADINSAAECLKAVNILFEELKNAKRSLINSETCSVNRNLMQAQLEYLRDNLPDTARKRNRNGMRCSKAPRLRHREWSMMRRRNPRR